MSICIQHFLFRQQTPFYKNSCIELMTTLYSKDSVAVSAVENTLKDKLPKCEFAILYQNYVNWFILSVIVFGGVFYLAITGVETLPGCGISLNWAQFSGYLKHVLPRPFLSVSDRIDLCRSQALQIAPNSPLQYCNRNNRKYFVALKYSKILASWWVLRCASIFNP